MKNKLKKILAVLLTAALVVASFTGCSSSGEGESSSGSSNSILYNVLEDGKLTVGMCLFIEPSSYYDESGNPVGYDVDIAQSLADSLGVELEIVDLAADARVSSLETGKVDIVLAQFTKTLERAQKIDFSDPYTASGPVMVTGKSSGISSTADLTSGKKIAVTTGSSHEAIVKAEFPDCELVYYASTIESSMAVVNGQADACVDDANAISLELQENDNLVSFGTIEGYVDYNCIGTVKGDQIWLNYLNDFVFSINSSNTNQGMYEKWFGSPMSIPLNPEY